MHFGTTFCIYGRSVDVAALKEKIAYQSGDLPDRPYISVANGSEAYQIVLDTLQAAHAEFRTSEYVEYTRQETETALYYQLNLAYSFQSQDKFGAKDFGVEYEYSCSKCRKLSTIIRQLSPMKLDLRKIGNWQMFFAPPAIIAREDVKQAIEQAGLTGIRFDKVMDHQGRAIESIHYQIHVEHILPPMNPYTIKLDGGYPPCKECGTTLTHLKNPISYSLKDFADAKDFNLSQEHLSNFNVQALIVSKRARDVIKKNVRRSHSIPILFVENIPAEVLEK